jgi:DNA-binding CsgD family transcriptional regulator
LPGCCPRGIIPKAIAGLLSLKYGYVRRILADMRRSFGVHSTRELVFMPDAYIHTDAPVVKLSPRGREVMEVFMRGCTYRQIAQCMGINLSGVQRHREKILWQNDCESMLELIARYKAQLAAADTAAQKTDS